MADRYQKIRVKDILVSEGDDKIDEGLVSAIVESCDLIGLLHPIAVRLEMRNREDGKEYEQYILVTGRHRYEAAKRRNRKFIYCLVVTAENDAEAEFVRLGEDLCKKSLTVLQQASALVRYVEFARMNFSGQVDQKAKLGRPQGGKSLAGREILVIGRTEDARRKKLERAEKIDGITPEAKHAAKEARLDNNQSALLKIAKADGPKAQLKMVKELAEISEKLGRHGTKKTATAKPAKSGGKTAVTQSAGRTPTTLDEMLEVWNSACRSKWRYLSLDDRERFHEKLSKAPCLDLPSAVDLLKKLLAGRKRLSKQHLFSFAATYAVNDKTVRKAVKGLGIRSKRVGNGMGATSYFLNPDQGYKDHLKIFSDSEIESTYRNSPHASAIRRSRSKRAPPDYFHDLDGTAAS